MYIYIYIHMYVYTYLISYGMKAAHLQMSEVWG